MIKNPYIYGFDVKKVVDRPVNYILKIEKIFPLNRTEQKQFCLSPLNSPFFPLKVGAGFGQYRDNTSLMNDFLIKNFKVFILNIVVGFDY
jgi:hypothetical protein